MNKHLLYCLLLFCGLYSNAQESVIKGTLFDKDSVVQTNLVISLFQNDNGVRIKLGETITNPFEFIVDDETKVYEIGVESLLPNDGQSMLDVVEMKNYVLSVYRRMNKGQYMAANMNDDDKISTMDLVHLVRSILGDNSDFLDDFRIINPKKYTIGSIGYNESSIGFKYAPINTFANFISNSDFIVSYIGDPMSGNESYVSTYTGHEKIELNVEDLMLEAGKTIFCKINFNIPINLAAAQFGFKLKNIDEINLVEKPNYILASNISISNAYFAYLGHLAGPINEGPAEIELELTPTTSGHISDFIEIEDQNKLKTEIVYSDKDYSYYEKLLISDTIEIQYNLNGDGLNACENFWPPDVVLSNCIDIDLAFNTTNYPCMSQHHYGYKDEYFYENDECVKVERTWARFHDDGSITTNIQIITFNSSPGDFCHETIEVLLDNYNATIPIVDLIYTATAGHDYSFDFNNANEIVYPVSGTTNQVLQLRSYDLTDSLSCYTEIKVIACAEGSEIKFKENVRLVLDENDSYTLNKDRLDEGSYNNCDEIIDIKLSKNSDGPYVNEILFSADDANNNFNIYIKYVYSSGQTVSKLSRIRVAGQDTKYVTFHLFNDLLLKGNEYEIEFRASDLEEDILGLQTEIRLKDVEFVDLGYGEFKSNELVYRLFEDENIIRMIWVSSANVVLNKSNKLFSIFIKPDRDIYVSEIFSIEEDHDFKTEVVNANLETFGLELDFVFETRSITNVKNEFVGKELMVYPNPISGDDLTIDNRSSKNIDCNVEIYNSQGQKVSSTADFHLKAGKSTMLDLHSACLTDGLYYINFSGETINLSKRILKIK